MAELRQIKTAPGLVFDALSDGPEGASLVLLLHGFAESFHMWRSQLTALAAAGYRAIAPSQRGYSPGARPHELPFRPLGCGRHEHCQCLRLFQWPISSRRS